MRKETYANTMAITYEATRKGAKYTFDEVHYMNHGEYCECLAKYCLGYEPKKDTNTRFDKGEDIPELKASVKSTKCGLTDKKLADNRKDYMRKFWRMSPMDTIYIWVYENADIVNLWYMTRKEFQRFCRQFGSWDNYCKKIRFTTCDNKVNKWLEAQI